MSTKSRQIFYRALLTQLEDDLLFDVAEKLQEATGLTKLDCPSNILVQNTREALQDYDKQIVSDEFFDIDRFGSERPSFINFDQTSREHLFAFNHHKSVSSTSFSSDGLFFASGSHDASIRIFNVPKVASVIHKRKTDGDIVNNIKPLIHTVSCFNAPVTKLKFHPEAPFLAAAAENELRLLNCMHDGAHVRKVDWTFQSVKTNRRIRDFSFTSGGEYIALACDDPSYYLYSLETGDILTHSSDEVPNASLTAITTNSANSTIVTGSQDGVVAFWQNSQMVYGLQPHEGQGIAQLEQQGDYLITSGYDNNLCVFDVRNMTEPVSRFIIDREGNTPCFTLARNCLITPTILHKGNRKSVGLAVCDIYSSQIKTVESGHTDVILSLDYNPSRGLLATGSNDTYCRIGPKMKK
ncbi:hypothetical protein PCE1_003670 [Barthelona sp. PCE]